MWSRTRHILPFSPPARPHWPRPGQRYAQMRPALTAAPSTSSSTRMCSRSSVRSWVIDRLPGCYAAAIPCSAAGKRPQARACDFDHLLYETQLDQHRADLTHIDGTLRVLATDLDPD